MMTQRSGDVFLGIPFNIASYALLTHIFAREVGLEVGELIHTIGDAHIYHNHFDQVREQLSRTEYPHPQLKIDDAFSLTDCLTGNSPLDSVDKFQLMNYTSHSSIKAEMAV
jgi:thymidylate synthase